MSHSNYTEQVNQLGSDLNPDATYDLVIVGGGIYGSAMLWEASHRGLRTLLIEKDDFGSGTSANSLKTIHGGIRYLQQFDFKRCYESDREKVILRKIAPNLITRLPCAVESQATLTANAWAMRAGASLMNRISQLNSLGSGRHKELFKPAGVKKLPHLLNQSLQSAQSAQPKKANYLVWEDAQVLDSERLCLAFINASLNEGATALNYATVKDVKSLSSEQSHGYEIEYQHTEQLDTKRVTANMVIDCSANSSLNSSLNESLSKQPSSYVAGVNLVINHSFADYALAIPQPVNSAASDQAKGMLFLSPWRGMTLAGTWYYHTQKTSVDQAFVEQCCEHLHAALYQQGHSISLAEVKIKVVDVHFGFLPCEPDQDNPERSIVNQCVVHKLGTNWFRVEGNKYTTARLNAKKMIDRLATNNKAIKSSESHVRQLLYEFDTNQLDKQQLPAWQILIDRYAHQAKSMKDFFELADDQTRDALMTLLPKSEIYQIEVDYFAHDQQVKTLADLLYRRLNFNKSLPLNHDFITACCERMTLIRQWSAEYGKTNLDQVLCKERNKRILS